MLHKLIVWVERLIRKHGPVTGPFFEATLFPWVPRFESNWHAIRRELDQLLLERDSIPNFQDLSKEQARLTEGNQWKTFFLYAYGRKVRGNCARCPETVRLLEMIRGMQTAMFSILAAGKHIPVHRGPYNGVLRYHLGLIIPEPRYACRIRVGRSFRTWEEGKSLIFLDSYEHEVWNDTLGERVVLFVDFVRPLPFPLSTLNRCIIWLISRSPLVTEGLKKLQHPDLAGPETSGADR